MLRGALTLLADIHPTWSPAEAQSALMLTANQNTLSHDGTDATFFDMGAGYADVSAAAATGLVMDESFANYMKADPNVGGTPSAINLVTMANAKCVDTCSWTRTVKATKDGSWSAATMSISDGLALSVSPESFTLEAGQTQEITVTADVTESGADWSFGNVVLTADGMPEVKLPVATKADGNNLPTSLTITSNRSTGSITFPGLISKELSDISTQVFEQELLGTVESEIEHDEQQVWAVEIPEKDVTTIAITSTTSPDLDLYIFDAEDNFLGQSAAGGSNEAVTFNNLPAGTYQILIHNFPSFKCRN